MSQEEIKKILIRNKNKEFDAVMLKERLNENNGNVNNCLKKLRKQIDNGVEDDINYKLVEGITMKKFIYFCCKRRRKSK